MIKRRQVQSSHSVWIGIQAERSSSSTDETIHARVPRWRVANTDFRESRHVEESVV